MMKAQSARCSRFHIFLRAVFIYAWLVNLSETDSYFSIYILCAVTGLLCMCDNYKHCAGVPEHGTICILIFAGLFSLATLLANYPLFEPVTALISLFNMMCSFIGGIFVALNVLLCALNRLPFFIDFSERSHPVRLFLFTFGTIAGIDLLYLFFAMYPGVLTTDSITTMNQIMSGAYNNTMPFWHTMTVKLFYTVGDAIWGEINAAVAFFHCAQIVFVAACFAYALTTLYQAGVHKLYIGVFYLIYAFVPYNIVYSVTMWKDVLFGAAALLFVTAFYRILRDIGKSRIRNYVFFIIGGSGLSLWRTNGWYAFFVTALVMLFLLRKSDKKLLAVMWGILLLCWVLINPVLSALHVSETDMIEAFGVPFQQVARVVANGREMSAEEEALLSEAFDLSRVKELYVPETVDPIKFEAFRRDNQEYMKEHIVEFLKLYIRLGIRYPDEYLKAWVEETKGFWNGGYLFWIYTKGVDVNELGIRHTGGENPIAGLFSALFRYLEKPAIFQPLYSIGLHVWIVIACCLINAVKRRKELLLSIPLIVLIIGLWLGTPVYAEFRYAYPVFLTMPVILAATLFRVEEKQPCIE